MSLALNGMILAGLTTNYGVGRLVKVTLDPLGFS
jgi:hypothetical protein